MKKTLLIALGLLLAMPMAMADEAVYVVKKSGDVLKATGTTGSMFFKDSGIFYFTMNTTSATETTISGSFKVKVNDESIKSFATSVVEVGVAYSWFHDEPLYGIDATMKLGSELKSDDYSFTVHGLDHGVNYYFRPYIRIMGKVYYSNVITGQATSGEEQTLSLRTRIYSDGYDALQGDVERIDIYFSRYNVGSCTEGNPGSYFAWGEIEPKDEYTWDNYKWSIGDSIIAYIPDETSAKGLGDEDDVAHIAFGNDYHCTDYVVDDQLVEYSFKYMWSSRVAPDGTTINGWEFRDQNNANPVFVPAAGYYDGTTLIGYNERMLLWGNKTCNIKRPKESFTIEGNSAAFDDGTKSRYMGLPMRSVTIEYIYRDTDPDPDE